MFGRIFTLPGRVLTGIFAGSKKRAYRSIRQKQKHGFGIFIVSVICWFALAIFCLWGADKSGLLKNALDAGVGAGSQNEAATGDSNQAETSGAPDANTENTTEASITNSINDGSPVSEFVSSPPVSAVPSPTTGPAGEAALSEKQKKAVEGWVIMLHSIPKANNGRREAETRKSRYAKQGLEVEILDSDAFPRFLADNWVVGLGPFESKAQALKVANTVKNFTPNLRVRRGY